MAQILKCGNKILPEDKKYLTKCNVCGCKYVYSGKEIIIFNDIRYVCCPQCNYKNYILFKRGLKTKIIGKECDLT